MVQVFLWVLPYNNVSDSWRLQRLCWSWWGFCFFKDIETWHSVFINLHNLELTSYGPSFVIHVNSFVLQYFLSKKLGQFWTIFLHVSDTHLKKITESSFRSFSHSNFLMGRVSSPSEHVVCETTLPLRSQITIVPSWKIRNISDYMHN